MYDAYDSDSYFFSNEITFLLEQKDKQAILNIIKQKHCDENKEFIPTTTKKNDLMIWNVIFAREIIKQGTSKQFIHTLYNKFYRTIQSTNTLELLQKLELNIATSYLDILINFVEVTDNFIINKVIGFLYIRLEDHLSLKEISDELKVSVGHISRCFKKNMGVSIMTYFKHIKIDRAKTLLKSTDKTILEISAQLSFCDQGNFTKAFKEIVGITPTEYRNNYYFKIMK
jgi:AraC-like DNA-binding protein